MRKPRTHAFYPRNQQLPQRWPRREQPANNVSPKSQVSSFMTVRAEAPKLPLLLFGETGHHRIDENLSIVLKEEPAKRIREARARMFKQGQFDYRYQIYGKLFP